jgi:hypothetical protein
MQNIPGHFLALFARKTFAHAVMDRRGYVPALTFSFMKNLQGYNVRVFGTVLVD